MFSVRVTTFSFWRGMGRASLSLRQLKRGSAGGRLLGVTNHSGEKSVPTIARFRVVSSFLAVRAAVHEERFVRVPVGAIIESSTDTVDPGLITAMLDGE